MRILMINPSRLNERGQVLKYRRAFLPPLSLAILAGLTPRRHSIRVVNDLVENVDLRENYDLVAITAMTTQVARAYQLADGFRARGIKVVIGGMHATVMPEEVERHADAVVVGEAENLWKEVLADVERGKPRQRYEDAELPDLQSSVVPRWEHMNMGIYPRRFGARLPMMPVFTTRGCPYGCKFCSVTRFFGKSYRVRPVAHVLHEIEATGTKDFFFVDDNIACRADYTRELFRALAGKGIHWLGQISTTVLKNPDLIELAAKAGCTALFVGLESLSQTSLGTVNKRFNDVATYPELFSRMKAVGIVPFVSLIFGFDDDTPERFSVAVRFLQQHGIGYASLWILTPLPGTELFEQLKTEGRIEADDWSLYDLSHVVFRPIHFSKHQLLERYWQAYRELYSLPSIAKNVVRNLVAPRSRMSKLLMDLFYQPYFRSKVLAHDHPFSGGIGLIRDGGTVGTDCPNGA